MEKFVIEGGVPLSGTVTPAGNKNAALPLLACALLTDEDVTLRNVPAIRDTEALLELLVDLGVTVERIDLNTVKMNAANVQQDARGRRSGRAHPRVVPGRRPVARALRERDDAATRWRCDRPSPAGPAPRRLPRARRDGRARQGHRHHRARTRGLRAVRLLHGRAVRDGYRERADGRRRCRRTTIVRNAACEPHVQDVARMLNKMGAAIEGIGSNVMTVHGVAKLGGCDHAVSPDHIEIGSFMALAGVTGGELDIKGCVADDLRMVRLAFRRLGLESEVREDGTCHPGQPEAGRPARRRQLPVQDRRRPVARVPGRPHVDRRRAGHPGRGHRPHLRGRCSRTACSSWTS